MKCPIDDSELVMADRQGIEIDYCPKCRGVWLDRGELDKIIERMGGAAGPAPLAAQRAERRDDRDDRYRDDRHRDDRYRYPKKRKSLLGEIFDF